MTIQHKLLMRALLETNNWKNIKVIISDTTLVTTHDNPDV